MIVAPAPRAFKMRLLPGAGAEYRRQHDLIWPDLQALLKEAGACDYSIHLDAEDDVTLFAVITEGIPGRVESLANDPLMQRWWQHMGDLMQTDDIGRPLTWTMKAMFYLP